jgi:hypothetical protein
MTRATWLSFGRSSRSNTITPIATTLASGANSAIANATRVVSCTPLASITPSPR